MNWVLLLLIAWEGPPMPEYTHRWPMASQSVCMAAAEGAQIRHDREIMAVTVQGKATTFESSANPPLAAVLVCVQEPK